MSIVPQEDKCLMVFGEGSHQQILALRGEVLRLIHFDRADCYGSIRSRANRYFMEGATMMYVRQSESQHCMLSLAPYVDGPLNRHHRVRASAHTLALRSARCEGDMWKQNFQSAFVTKVFLALFNFLFCH